MNIRHIYWFAYYNISEPSVRYRGLYALRELEKKYGITYTIIYPGYSFENIAHFIRNYFSILFFRRSKSIIVFEKIRTGWIYGSALKILLWMRPERTAYDIDDADYLKFKPGNIYHFMKNCEKCFVGSKTLLEFTLQFNTNVYLAPSPVINHNCRKGIKNERLTIGWIGYYNAHRDSLLKLFFPALLNISFPVKLILLGVTNSVHKKEVTTYFNGHENITIEMPDDIDWLNELSIYSRICEFDIGIAPLLDTEINRSKSAFKTKQYLSCGVPVLGSTVGENVNYIRHGINGFICETLEHYEHFIASINEMDQQAYKLLSAGALESAASFSLDIYCTALLNSMP